MTDDVTARLDELQLLMTACTDGPWVRRGGWIDGGHKSYDEVLAPAPVECSTYCYGGSSRIELSDADADYIVAAANAVPWLVGLVRDLRVQLAVVTAQQRRVIALMDVVARLQLADADTGDRDVSFLALADAVYGDDQ